MGCSKASVLFLVLKPLTCKPVGYNKTYIKQVMDKSMVSAKFIYVCVCVNVQEPATGCAKQHHL
eukprot:9901336-Prorocentrum_lima.AAC.1